MGNTVKTVFLLGLLSGLLLVIGELLGGQSGLVIAFVFAVVMNFGLYWFSDKIVLRMYRAGEVGPEHPLHQMTARVARQAALPMPRVFVIPDESPNAFATGRNPDTPPWRRPRESCARSTSGSWKASSRTSWRM